jgi:hypothetical protein
LIALRATRLFGFRAWVRCRRLLRCSTARSQPDDHDRGYEGVRLDLPVFQEMPLLKIKPGVEPNA